MGLLNREFEEKKTPYGEFLLLFSSTAIVACLDVVKYFKKKLVKMVKCGREGRDENVNRR